MSKLARTLLATTSAFALAAVPPAAMADSILSAAPRIDSSNSVYFPLGAGKLKLGTSSGGLLQITAAQNAALLAAANLWPGYQSFNGGGVVTITPNPFVLLFDSVRKYTYQRNGSTGFLMQTGTEPGYSGYEWWTTASGATAAAKVGSLDGAGNFIAAGSGTFGGALKSIKNTLDDGAGNAAVAGTLGVGGAFAAPSVSTPSALAKQLQTFATTLQGAICDGNSHLLSASYASLALAQVDYPGATALTQEKDEAAFYTAAGYALTAPTAQGGEVVEPAGTCRFTAPAAFSIAEGKSLRIRGVGLGTKLLFPAASGNAGLSFTFSPMAASTDSATLVPSAHVADLQMVTTATTNAGGGTAIYAANGSVSGSQYVNLGIPQMTVDHVMFTALNGGGHAGNAGSWAIGFDAPGLWETNLHDSFFQGGLTGSSTAANNDTASIFERLTATGTPTASSNIHVNRNNTMSYGGTFLQAGDVNTTAALQGLDVSSATTVGTNYDIVYAVQSGGDWLTVANSNFESVFGSVVTNAQTLSWKGNYCIGGSVRGNNPCLTGNGLTRAYIGGNQFIIASPSIVINNSIGTDTYGNVQIDANQFAQTSGPVIRLAGSTSGVMAANNLDSSPTSAMFNDTTGRAQAIGWNFQQGAWGFGASPVYAGYAPSVTCGSGTYGGTASARFKQLGKTINISLRLTVGSTPGSCSGTISIQLPVTTVNAPSYQYLSGQEDATTGRLAQGQLYSNVQYVNLQVIGSTGIMASPTLAANQVYDLSGTYESQ